MLHVKKAFDHIKSLVEIGSVSPRWRSQGVPARPKYFSLSCLAGPRFILHVYLLCSHFSFINTFKHEKDAFICNLMVFVLCWISFHRTNTIRNLYVPGVFIFTYVFLCYLSSTYYVRIQNLEIYM